MWKEAAQAPATVSGCSGLGRRWPLSTAQGPPGGRREAGGEACAPRSPATCTPPAAQPGHSGPGQALHPSPEPVPTASPSHFCNAGDTSRKVKENHGAGRKADQRGPQIPTAPTGLSVASRPVGPQSLPGDAVTQAATRGRRRHGRFSDFQPRDEGPAPGGGLASILIEIPAGFLAAPGMSASGLSAGDWGHGERMATRPQAGE